MICEYCSKEVEPSSIVRPKRFCSTKCRTTAYYTANKSKIRVKTRKWADNNKEKVKKYHVKAMYKYRTEKREQFNSSILKSYHRYKDRWRSRNETRRILNKCVNKKVDIQKICVNCGSIDNLKLKFDFYPVKSDEIRKALIEGKIRYLCGKCWIKKENKTENEN